MCGIAGFAGIGDEADLHRMTQALVHRGPDASGTFVDTAGRVFLGHRRLAILDIEGGVQPMWNADGSIGVIYNGEIYNASELRAELEDKGHVFRTSHSDTEVLIHGYKEWGTDLNARLNGMFAFAVYDRSRRRLVLARDRFGEKPLYYACSPNVFAFASELEALTRHSAVSTDLDDKALLKYFAYGYIVAPMALYRGTRKLPGGHTLVYDLASGETRTWAYWSFRLQPDEGLTDEDETELVEELRHLLFDATKRRLVSDVPLGVFLSGGLDSSAILIAASQHVPPEDLQTFTIGFNDVSYDESGYARSVADNVGTRHRQRILDLSGARDLIAEVLPRMDEPLGDPSILPTYMLSAFARENVTVALSGDGGDELFAGYDTFSALAPAGAYARLIPPGLHALIRRGATLLPRSERNMSLDFKVQRALAGLSFTEQVWAPTWMAPLEPSAISELFGYVVPVEDLYEEAIATWEATEGDRVDRMLTFFTRFYLQDDILAKVDRATMMCSLESRAVFLDNDLVDFCCRLPNRFKFRNGRRKYLLKKVLTGLLPTDIIERRKKGFGIPVATWLKSYPAEPPMRSINALSLVAAAQKWEEHRAGKADHRLFLWSWLALQQVLRSSDTDLLARTL